MKKIFLSFFLIFLAIFFIGCANPAISSETNMLQGLWKTNIVGIQYLYLKDNQTYIVQTNYDNTEADQETGTYAVSGGLLKLTSAEGTHSFKYAIDGDLLSLTNAEGISVTVNYSKQIYTASYFYTYKYNFINHTDNYISIHASTNSLWDDFTIEPNNEYILILWKSYNWYFSYSSIYNCDTSQPGEIIFTLKQN